MDNLQSIIANLPDSVVNVICTIIGAIITRFIAKIANPKPSQYLQIAYDKVYYPLYRELREKKQSNSNINYAEFRDFFGELIEENDKYVDQTTINVYNQFNDAVNQNNEYKIREIYNGKIWENITYTNNKLRRILGYLQPNLFQIYMYSSIKAKFFLNFATLITLELICIQVAFILYSIEIVVIISVYTAMTIMGLIIVNIIWFCIMQLQYFATPKIISFVKWVKQKLC